jgi:hypothetical protein
MRYKASTERHDIGHRCCNSAAVLDTAVLLDNSLDDDLRFEVICECTDIGTAEMIAAALNKMEP